MLLIGVAGGMIPWIQFFEIMVNKSSKDVSLSSYILVLIVVFSWLVYGVVKKDKIIIVANAISVLGAAVCLISILYWK